MVLILVCVLVCMGIEVGSATLFSRLSRIENRRTSEYANALAIRPVHNQHEASVLVAGNSLLLEGVDFHRLQEDVGSGIELRRAVVENTFYLDWYYGLRRLFRMGSQPDAVVLMLNPSQLTSEAIDGDYTAHLLLDSRDLLKLAKDTGADRNRLSAMALSNVSFFYSTRAEIRNWILGKLLPDLPTLTKRLHSPPRLLDPSTVQAIATVRLRQLQQVCQEHEVNLVVVIPPSLKDSGEMAVMRASEATRVPVLLPIRPGELAESYYSDGFHLNSIGAEKFTPALAEGLRKVLSVNYARNTNTAPQASSNRPAASPADALPAYLEGLAPGSH
jgi:hypothetical protein